MTTHSNILAWGVSWTGELGMDRGAGSPWGRKESDTTQNQRKNIFLAMLKPKRK